MEELENLTKKHPIAFCSKKGYVCKPDALEQGLGYYFILDVIACLCESAQLVLNASTFLNLPYHR